MLNLPVRLLMGMAAVVTGWFIASDSVRFGVVQMAVSLLLLTFIVAIAAFWPSLARWLGRPGKPPRGEKE